MLAGIIMMAAATVGGEWVDGAVRFETGNDAANRIVASGSSGAYPSKVAEVYENLRHTGNKAEAKKNWQMLYSQVRQAASDRHERAVTDDAFLGACWWLFEARMMCEIELANVGRLNFDPEYVQMNIEAFNLIREQYVENGMLALKDKWKVLNFSTVTPMKIQENNILTLSENDTVKTAR